MIQSKSSLLVVCGTVVLATTAASLFVGCGTDAAQVSNPKVTMAFGTYTAQNSIMDLLIPSAYAAISNGKLCFKRLRFKTDGESTSSDPTSDSDNIDFSPGEVSLSGTGSSLGDVTIPAGTYKRIEFDLEKNCPGSTSGNSVSFTNANGAFVTDQRVTIKFEGTFVASENGQKVTLATQNIIDALNTVTSVGDIKTKLESASVKGSF